MKVEHWEFEIGLDEIETPPDGKPRHPAIQKTRTGQTGNLGLLITHYAIRHLMHQAAEDIDLDEDRLSFIRSLRVIRRSITGDADFPPQQADELFAEALREIAERPNPETATPRLPQGRETQDQSGKIIEHHHHRQVRYKNPAKIRITNQAA